jgi:hypothetical protein
MCLLPCKPANSLWPHREIITPQPYSVYRNTHNPATGMLTGACGAVDYAGSMWDGEMGDEPAREGTNDASAEV